MRFLRQTETESGACKTGKFICSDCGTALCNDDVALTLRLRGMGTGALFCMRCLAARLDCPEDRLCELREQLKQVGCAFFERSYMD